MPYFCVKEGDWLELNRIYNEDCLEGMKQLKDKSINLIIIDPPYNINKAKWDKWKTVLAYVEWMGKVFIECQRVLMDNGSFYFFHNDFLQIVELQNWLNKNTKFIFKQFIVWNKRFENAKLKQYLDGYVAIEMNRNYKKMAEYCLFYTFQDETGLNTTMLDTNNFSTMRKYFYEMLCYMGETNKSIARKLGHRKAEHCFYVLPKKRVIETIGQKAVHCFRYGSTQWDMPTLETYKELIEKFNIDKWIGFKTHESLRLEYESLRYTFNNQKTHHSIWNYEIAKKERHITPKPIELIENIIKHSSNENDIILDCFMGSGTTAISAINTNRNYIGFELDTDYFNVANERINDLKKVIN